MSKRKSPAAIVPLYSCADQSMLSLPEDIIGEILNRLPIKYLFRLKCLSKQYNSFISSPNLAQNYLQHAYSCKSGSLSGLLSSFLFPFTDVSPDQNIKNLTDTVIDHSRLRSFYLCSLSLPHDNKCHKILGSSNGLVLSVFHPDEAKARFGLCVSNPLTNQCVQLPSPTTSTRFDELEFAIATRRVRASSAFVSYKIVIIRRKVVPSGCKHENTTVEIFSSDTGSWAALELSCPRAVLTSSTWRAGFVRNGIFHLLDRRMGTVITYDPFDSPDRFGCILLPKGEYRQYSDSCLVYSGDQEIVKYCEIYQCVPRYKVCIMSLWRLVDSDNGEWCLERKFEIRSFSKCFMTLLVAPNPWKRHLSCYPYVIDSNVTVINSRDLRTKSAKVVLGRKHERALSAYFMHPLVLIQTCPWSSPFYAQAS